MVQLIGKRLMMLVVCVLFLNWLYDELFYYRDMQSKSPEHLAIMQTQDSTDVYYFGESSNVTYALTDSLQESISELAGRYYPGLRIRNINKYATHAGIYKSWLRMIRPGSALKAVVITMNLRSFDAAWIHSELETQLRESSVLVEPYPHIVNRFLLSLQAFDNKNPEQRKKDMLHDWKTRELRLPGGLPYKTVSEWDLKMSQGGHLKADGSWDQPKIELACHYIKSYAFNLDDSNPRVQDFDLISAWCKNNRIKLYLNLMAENVHYADSLVGPELVALMRENRDFLMKRYSSDCVVIDNLEAVKGEDFIDKTWTTEHYDIHGRLVIARNVAEAMKAQFSDKYFRYN